MKRMAEGAHSGLLIVGVCVVLNAANSIRPFECCEECEGRFLVSDKGHRCANVCVCGVWNEVRVLGRQQFREQGLLEEVKHWEHRGTCNKIGRILPMEVATAKCQLAAGIH